MRDDISLQDGGTYEASGKDDEMAIGILESNIKDLMALDNQERAEFTRDFEELLKLGEAFGDSKEVFAARLNRQMRAFVAEVCSPPRVTKAATALPELGIAPGSALDITTCDEHGTPWDFSRPDMRRKAEKLLDDEDPDLLVGSVATHESGDDEGS